MPQNNTKYQQKQSLEVIFEPYIGYRVETTLGDSSLVTINKESIQACHHLGSLCLNWKSIYGQAEKIEKDSAFCL